MRKQRRLTSIGIVGVMLAVMVLFTLPAQAISAEKTGVKTLRMALWFPQTSDVGQSIIRLIAAVEERSGGRLKIEPFWSSSLLGMRNIGTGIKAGIADIGYWPYSVDPGMLPASITTCQLGIVYNAWAGLKALEEFRELDVIKKEWEALNMVLLYPSGSPGYVYMGVKPVRTIEDMKRLSIYGVTPVPEVFRRFGITCVSMAAPDLYEALQRGVIDGVFYGVEYMTYNGWHEVVKYYNPDLNLGGKTYAITMNRKAFNSLSPDLQQILKSIDYTTMWHEEVGLKGMKLAMEAIKSRGIEIIHSPLEVLKKIRDDGINPEQDKWVAEASAKGIPARMLLDKWINLASKWGDRYAAEATKRGWPGPELWVNPLKNVRK
jgi:TRAP-type C4-dicarboxylate transport system substrate-binding protein